MPREATDFHDEFGRPIVYVSPRPPGTTTFFSGAGDNQGVSDGSRLLFSLAATDAVKTIDLTFTEALYIKDGFFVSEGAPFGAYLDAEIVHPVDGVVGSFARKVPVYGSWPINLETNDKSTLLPAGMIIRITVGNSNGEAPQEPAAAFKLAGRLEFYRATTA